MSIYEAETKVDDKGTITLEGVPFPPGVEVHVAVCSLDQEERIAMRRRSKDSPLRHQPIEYIEPLEPVSEDEWEALS